MAIGTNAKRYVYIYGTAAPTVVVERQSLSACECMPVGLPYSGAQPHLSLAYTQSSPLWPLNMLYRDV